MHMNFDPDCREALAANVRNIVPWFIMSRYAASSGRMILTPALHNHLPRLLTDQWHRIPKHQRDLFNAPGGDAGWEGAIRWNMVPPIMLQHAKDLWQYIENRIGDILKEQAEIEKLLAEDVEENSLAAA